MDMLLDVAKTTGLKDCTEATLTNQELLQSVKREMAEVKHKFSVSGVPHFIVGNKIQLSGAQPAEYFLKVFDHLATEMAKNEQEEEKAGQAASAAATEPAATTTEPAATDAKAETTPSL